MEQERYVPRHKNWSVRWTNMGSEGNDNYVAMFSCPSVGTNILYPLSLLQEVLEGRDATQIPRKVMAEAIQNVGNNMGVIA